MARKPRIDPDRWYVALETASCTVGPGPGDFVTVHESERRHGSDPFLQHANVRQFFVDEAETTPEQRTAIVAERRRAEWEAIRAEEKRRQEEAVRVAAEQREQARVEAAKRRVIVREPYTPEMADPTSERGVHPMTFLAAGIAAAMGKEPT